MCNHRIKIGKLEISTPLFLAPMAGLTHSALRQLILDFGGVGLLSTEMLSASSLPQENPSISSYLVRTYRERPMSYQLLVYSARHVEKAVEKIEALGADAVDINLGCGAPKVVKKGGGVALSRDMKRLTEIVSKVKKTTDLPVTVKIRLGPRTDVTAFEDRCRVLEDLGIDALYVHARFDKEPFARPPRWDIAASAKRAVSIPVIINGGIFSTKDARRCFEITRADGIMLGRGAAVRPWIFRQINETLFREKGDFDASMIKLPEVWLRFFDYLERLFLSERRLGRLKEFSHYFSQNYAFGNRLAMAVQRSKTMEEARSRAMEFFEKNQTPYVLT